MTTSQTWTAALADVASDEALALLREFYIDVSDRYYQHHFGRDSTPEEIEEGLAGSPSDHLAPPTGVFLIGRYHGTADACAGLKIVDDSTVELTRMFVRHARRRTGGGAFMLAAVDSAARDLGASQIILDTRLDLVEARELYLKHGYVEVPAFTDRQYAEVFYSKDLTA
ncbi:GNAT family N-acetyltransferase [Lentzea tibetensis]|uniref:GNAT family N-acetyltransferase n=1 Tax=Lentzea tibetensis TaxID=2591470 RepID=A0A563EJA7_9PSEU|nr:GNAT family N-acetyltransferase [Lentzea tibetensis]TWP46118.1 GNAT family N-acetyltransferase [Lentzea tibetensis]